jgi:O-antigen ligase
MRLLAKILTAATLVILARLLITEDLKAVAMLVGILGGTLVVSVSVATRWPLGAILVLIVGSATPRFAVTVFSLHIRPEHLAIAVVTLALCVQFLKSNICSALNLQTYDYFLLAYIVMNFCTSALASPEPHKTLRWALLNAVVISPYFLLRLLIRNARQLYKSAQMLLWVGAAEAAYGVICFLSNRAFKTSFGVSAEQYGFMPGTHGSQYEANLFGSYTACCAIMFLACFLLSHESRKKFGIGFLVALVGALISLARSVLLALPVAILFVVWVALKRGQLQIRKLFPLAAGAGLLLLAISPLVMNFASERVSTIDISQPSTDDTTMTRLIQTAAALEDVRTHPIMGTGTASFQLLFNWDDYLPGMGADTDQGGWIGNSPLRILHDTGIVGLAVFVMFLATLASATRKAIRIAPRDTRTVLAALAAGLLLYAITFQATEATILAFTWVHVGLLGAAAQISQTRQTV